MDVSTANEMKTVFKKFKYVAPSPPAHLIDCTNFTLDFAERKFINVGLDPTNHFELTVQIVTPSRYVNISSDFLDRIFSLMGNLLSFILDQPIKYKRVIFLETDTVLLSSMVYRGEIMLVIEDKMRNGCRILLNRANLLTLQYLEWSICEAVERKNKIIRPMVLQQFDQICTYFKNNFKRVENIEEMSSAIKNLSDDLISSQIPKSNQSFVSQLKLCATKQLAEQCVMKVENNTTDIKIGYDCSHTSIPSISPTPQCIPIQDNQYEIAIDQNDGPSYLDFQYSICERDSEMYWLPKCN